MTGSSQQADLSSGDRIVLSALLMQVHACILAGLGDWNAG